MIKTPIKTTYQDYLKLPEDSRYELIRENCSYHHPLYESIKKRQALLMTTWLHTWKTGSWEKFTLLLSM